jgi:hypothetical protein
MKESLFNWQIRVLLWMSISHVLPDIQNQDLALIHTWRLFQWNPFMLCPLTKPPMGWGFRLDKDMNPTPVQQLQEQPKEFSVGGSSVCCINGLATPWEIFLIAFTDCPKTTAE